MTQPSIQDVDAAVRSILFARGRAATNGGEVFAERLLSLRQAESLGRGTIEVKVAPGTVVTPLARDYLKQHGIGLRVVSTTQRRLARDPGEWGFAIETETGLIAAFRRALLEDSPVWNELEGSVDSVARWVVEKPARGALLVADEGSVAVWKGCQRPGVRAALAADVDSVDRANRCLGANLLVIEPRGKSILMLRQMSLTYRRPGAPRVPGELEREDAR